MGGLDDTVAVEFDDIEDTAIELLDGVVGADVPVLESAGALLLEDVLPVADEAWVEVEGVNGDVGAEAPLERAALEAELDGASEELRAPLDGAAPEVDPLVKVMPGMKPVELNTVLGTMLDDT